LSNDHSTAFNAPKDVEGALKMSQRDVSDPARRRAFVPAVKASVDLGSPAGEEMLLRAYAKVPFECRVTILSGLSYLPTDAVADALKAIASDTQQNPSLRGGAVWTLGWFRREADGSFLLSGITDPILRGQAIPACMHHGTPVPSDTVLQLLARLARTKSLSREQGPPTSFMVLVALYARGGKDATAHLDRFGRLIDRMWPRLTQQDRAWVQSYWPEALDRNLGGLRTMSPQQLDQLAEWASGLPGWQQPMIY
jgi:hypothetical protein